MGLLMILLRATVSDIIRWSSDIYIEHIIGRCQYENNMIQIINWVVIRQMDLFELIKLMNFCMLFTLICIFYHRLFLVQTFFLWVFMVIISFLMYRYCHGLSVICIQQFMCLIILNVF